MQCLQPTLQLAYHEERFNKLCDGNRLWAAKHMTGVNNFVFDYTDWPRVLSQVYEVYPDYEQESFADIMRDCSSPEYRHIMKIVAAHSKMYTTSLATMREAVFEYNAAGGARSLSLVDGTYAKRLKTYQGLYAGNVTLLKYLIDAIFEDQRDDVYQDLYVLTHRDSVNTQRYYHVDEGVFKPTGFTPDPARCVINEKYKCYTTESPAYLRHLVYLLVYPHQRLTYEQRASVVDSKEPLTIKVLALQNHDKSICAGNSGKRRSVPGSISITRSIIWRNAFKIWASTADVELAALMSKLGLNGHTEVCMLDMKCYCCNSETISIANYAAGHILAHDRGGLMKAENLRPICVNCNSAMSDCHMGAYIKAFGYKDSAGARDPALEGYTPADLAEAEDKHQKAMAEVTTVKRPRRR